MGLGGRQEGRPCLCEFGKRLKRKLPKSTETAQYNFSDIKKKKNFDQELQVQTLSFTQTAQSPAGASSAATGGCGSRWRRCAGTVCSAGTCHTGPGGRACPRPWGEVRKGSHEQVSPESLLGASLGSQGSGRDTKGKSPLAPVLQERTTHLSSPTCFGFVFSFKPTSSFLLPAACRSPCPHLA